MQEVYEYFAAADACLLPMEVNLANAARWHSKVTDYLNAGAPVALTPVSDFPEHFTKHSMGWLAASGTPQDYAATLLQAVADKPHRAEKSRAARAFMRQELDVMAIAERATAFYRLCAARLL
jgi:glycosyltransferase involved in cell wall biosynthesis